MRKLLGKIKDNWKKLSLTSRKDVKWQAVGAIALAGAVTFLGLAATPLLAALGVHIAVSAAEGACYALALAGVGYIGAVLPGLIKEIRHGQEKVTWKNAIGQTVESTRVQQKDLQEYEAEIKSLNSMGASFGRHSKKMARFNRVADKVTIKEDIPGNVNNRYLFYPQPAPTFTFQK